MPGALVKEEFPFTSRRSGRKYRLTVWNGYHGSASCNCPGFVLAGNCYHSRKFREDATIYEVVKAIQSGA